MDRVMKFVLQGRPLNEFFDETHMVHFSDKIKAFLDEHPDEVVYVSVNKTTAEKMRKSVIYSPTLEKIAEAFQNNLYGKDYKCLAYVGPNEDAINKAIEDTIIGAGNVAYTLDLRPLNGYIHKPIRRNCDD